MNRIFRYIAVVVMLLMLALVAAGCSDHAPGYGQTDKCTICGKKATHSSTNYGFCDKHWKEATGW